MSRQDLTKVNDVQLEALWQASADKIGVFIKMYWKTNDEQFRIKAEQAQQRQSEIQKEISRRH